MICKTNGKMLIDLIGLGWCYLQLSKAMLQPPSREVEALINAWFDVQLGHNCHG